MDVGLNMWEGTVFCSMFKQQQMPSCLHVALFFLFIMTTISKKACQYPQVCGTLP